MDRHQLRLFRFVGFAALGLGFVAVIILLISGDYDVAIVVLSGIALAALGTIRSERIFRRYSDRG